MRRPHSLCYWFFSNWFAIAIKTKSCEVFENSGLKFSWNVISGATTCYDKCYINCYHEFHILSRTDQQQ